MDPELNRILSDAPIFSKLSDEQRTQVCKYSKVITVKNHYILFSQGEKTHSFYYLVKGKVKLSRVSPSGQEKIVEVFRNDRIFAESLMFAEKSEYPVTAVALENTEIVQINAKNFRRILQNSMETCFLIMSDLSQRLHFLIDEIDHLSLQTASFRVASYFLEHIAKEGHYQRLDLPKIAIASRLSIKPETFSRILKDFTSRGLIQVDGAMVMIVNRKGLVKELGI